jgi:allene oxide cyclase
MKKLAIVLAALAAPGVAAASGTTLHLTEKQTFQQYVDKGAKGESPGDIRTFGGTVFQDGKRVGHDRIRCVVGATCNSQVWIAGGSLIANGFVTKGPSFTAKITGGTGKYAGARGTVSVVVGRTTKYTVRLAG